jgi:DNA-binding XRE family transcriptional regulator
MPAAFTRISAAELADRFSKLPVWARRCRLARIQAKLSRHEAAAAWGVPFGTLQRWEQGMNEPSVEVKARLAPILDAILGETVSIQLPAHNQTEIATELGISRSLASYYKGQGMPVDSADAAREWMSQRRGKWKRKSQKSVNSD